MARIMHINASGGFPRGATRALCGETIPSGRGAKSDAPMCEKCVKINNRKR